MPSSRISSRKPLQRSRVISTRPKQFRSRSSRLLLKGVIFDIDGTLVDSNDAHAKSWVDTFAEAGYDVPFDAVRPLIGMGADKLLPKTVGIKHDTDEGKKLIKR